MRFAAILGVLAARAWACSCFVSPVGNPPCQSASRHDAVFTGMVTAIDGRRVTFRIAEPFTGLDPKLQEIVVETGLGVLDRLRRRFTIGEELRRQARRGGESAACHVFQA
jgi:hypothetical protein